MANIVFCFPPLISSLNTSLRLARMLKTEGHRVSYIGIPDCEDPVNGNGFDFFPVYGEWFPKGYYLNMQSEFNNDQADKADIYNRFGKVLDHIINGGDSELFTVMDGIKPDIVLIATSNFDTIAWSLLMYKMKYKSIYIFDVLGGVVNHTAPPIHTETVSNGTLYSFMKNSVEWLYFYVKKLNASPNKKIVRMANYCGYPKKYISFFNDMPSPLINLPELVLFPRRFDFPRVKKEGRYYVEASIDLDRESPSFPWDKVADQPIVYVALGTISILAKSDYENFFRIVIKASTKWPEWNWVLSIGNNLRVDDFNFAPSNVIVVNRAPQLELLKKASLMITHGGPSSVKECIFFGVPMIVFPLWFDQPGNVARVTYHGLGLKGNFKTINTKELQELIEEVTTNSRFRERIKVMQKHFMDIEDAKPSIQLIEQFIAQPSIPPFLD